jgi:hypothetical protein
MSNGQQVTFYSSPNTPEQDEPRLYADHSCDERDDRAKEDIAARRDRRPERNYS